jgi:hypothetical protein
MTSLENYCLCDCKLLSSIIIPNSMTSLKDGYFYGYESLSSISIPDSTAFLGNDSC